MADLIDRIRGEQSRLADTIAGQLFEELKPYIENGKFNALNDYVPHSFCGELDLEALKAFVMGNLKSCVNHAVIGYSDWLLSRMVRENEYSVPAPKEIDRVAIQGRYKVQPKLLERVISSMHSRNKLPLLGKINKGRFNPDAYELEQWKEMYNWE